MSQKLNSTPKNERETYPSCVREAVFEAYLKMCPASSTVTETSHHVERVIYTNLSQIPFVYVFGPNTKKANLVHRIE